MSLRSLCLVALSLVACGRSSSSSVSTTTGPAAPLMVQLGRYTDVDVPLAPLAAGQVMTLTAAIQGGFVVYVAPRVRGLTTPEVEVRARVRDPDSGELLIDEVRTPRLVATADDPGLFEPDLGQFREINHLVLCPHNSEATVLGRDLLLEVTVTEREGDTPNHGVATVPLRFACPDGAALPAPLRCGCQCAPSSQKTPICYPDGD